MEHILFWQKKKQRKQKKIKENAPVGINGGESLNVYLKRNTVLSYTTLED